MGCKLVTATVNGSPYFTSFIYCSGPFGSSVFRSKHQCIRVWYKLHGEAGYFHTFRVPNVRAFNNTVIEIKSEDEEKGRVG